MKTHLDLFSGIGGFSIAAQACGYTTIGFCEKEPYAQQVLIKRFGAIRTEPRPETGPQRFIREAQAEIDRLRADSIGVRKLQPQGGEQDIGRRAGDIRCPRLHPDIFTLNGADYAGVDLLTGGFPCQPFSVAGKRRGAEDDRAIWPEMLRVINEARPRWIIGENVAGIVTMELDNILSDLEGIGYAAWPIVIPACAVDARHRRDRVWIVAHRTGAGLERKQRSQHEGRGNGFTHKGEDVAHAHRTSTQGNKCAQRSGAQRAIAGEHCEWRNEGEWFAESGMGRVAHGIPHRAHRLRGLGNAIVPQVSEEIIRAIATIDEHGQGNH